MCIHYSKYICIYVYPKIFIVVIHIRLPFLETSSVGFLYEEYKHICYTYQVEYIKMEIWKEKIKHALLLIWSTQKSSVIDEACKMSEEFWQISFRKISRLWECYISIIKTNVSLKHSVKVLKST